MSKFLKIVGALALGVSILVGAEVIEPGLTTLLRSDNTTFSNERIVGAGDTIWTTTYQWGGDWRFGINFLEFDIDTFAACSSKVEVILRESNTDGDWTYQASLITIDHAPSDWDTVFEVSYAPMALYRLGFLLKNGTDDSCKVSNVKQVGR